MARTSATRTPTASASRFTHRPTPITRAASSGTPASRSRCSARLRTATTRSTSNLGSSPAAISSAPRRRRRRRPRRRRPRPRRRPPRRRRPRPRRRRPCPTFLKFDQPTSPSPPPTRPRVRRARSHSPPRARPRTQQHASHTTPPVAAKPVVLHVVVAAAPRPRPPSAKGALHSATYPTSAVHVKNFLCSTLLTAAVLCMRAWPLVGGVAHAPGTAC